MTIGSVRLISSTEQFDELRSQWNAIVGASGMPPVFHSHEWFSAAWQWRQLESSRLYLLCHFVESRLVAVLPLILQRVHSRVSELAFLTVPDTQACDLIVAESDQASAATAIAAELVRRRRDWDVLRLRYLRPGAVAGGPLRRSLEAAGLSTMQCDAPGNPFIGLDTTWASYYATRSRRLKKANNLAFNRLGKAGAVTIERFAGGPAEKTRLPQLVEAVIDISRRSWKTRTGNSLEQPGPQAFIRRLSDSACTRGWLLIWILRLDGNPIAMEYQLVADGEVRGLRSDFDAALEDLSPGTYLNRYLLEQLFGSGLRRYYLGPGNNAYKYRWTEDAEPVTGLNVYGLSLTGRYRAAWERRIKPAARTVIERFRRPAQLSTDFDRA